MIRKRIVRDASVEHGTIIEVVALSTQVVDTIMPPVRGFKVVHDFLSAITIDGLETNGGIAHGNDPLSNIRQI